MKFELTKDKIYMAIGVLTLLIAGLVYYLFFTENNENIEDLLQVPMVSSYENENIEENEYITEQIEEQKETTYKEQKVTVFISGEVNNIGVFTLDLGARVIDILNKAGGPTELADLNRINLANFLTDAEHIIIPSIYDDFYYSSLAKQPTTEISAAGSQNLININTADKNTLQLLPGIGPAIAENIINYRTENNFFRTIAEIQNVPRIGPRIFNNISSLITVE
ncbi:MAG: helix-hairpin-helix domain-containing protein [Defluviitaleaceae bacterium]|nr:helix-hairpin-helix domain-containing protein [Defluviitaleaceae bacterium]